MAGKLNQHCALCGTVGVTYVKTKGGFHKVCDSCKKVLEDAGLTVEPLQVRAVSDRIVFRCHSGISESEA